jgi:hypothetical protein
VIQPTTATVMFHILIKAKNVLGSEELIAAEIALLLVEELLYVNLHK